MKAWNTLFAPLSLGLVLTACGTGQSEDVRQSTIQQSYGVSFDENTQVLIASARFNYENAFGTSLKLTGDSEISFDGRPMSYENILGSSSYGVRRQARSDERLHEFRYRNNDGEIFPIRAEIPSPIRIAYPFDGQSFPRDRELTVRLEGQDSNDDATITVCLKTDGSSSEGIGIQECLTTQRVRSLVWSREQLARFPPDRTLRFELRRDRHPPQNNGRIQLSETYVGRSISARLE